MTIAALTKSEQKQFHFEQGEILNINKPSGWTSFDVVKKIRNLARVKKVGHAGTLDPFATGVLVVCTGRATKKINEFVETSKEYVGEIFLGAETDTYDVTGKVITQTDCQSSPDLSEVERVLDDFRGDILQTPPMYSALKVNGKRLYQYAREGKTITRKERNVTIHSLQVESYHYPSLTVRVNCSKGTYIRSLAHDIGRALDVGGYLKSLVRTRVGDFLLEDAWELEDFATMMAEA